MPGVVPRFEDPAFAVDTRSPATAPVWGVAPALNFDAPNGEPFVFNSAGELVLAAPMSSLEQLITKAMLTERLFYPVYDKEFGSDFWVLIGRSLSDLAVQQLAEQFVRQAIGNINLVRAVDQIATQVVSGTLYLGFRVTAISGAVAEFNFARTLR